MICKRLSVVKMVSIVVFAILCMFITNKVKAEEVYAGDYVDRIYIKKMKGGLSPA